MNIYDMIFPDVLMTSSTSKSNAKDIEFHYNLEQNEIFMEYVFPFCSVCYENACILFKYSKYS